MPPHAIAGRLRLASFTIHLLIDLHTSEDTQDQLVDVLDTIDLRQTLEACARAELARHPFLTAVAAIAEE